MPNNRLHNKLWQMAFGSCGYPSVPVDKQMDEYSQKLPGIRHRQKDHDPLRAGDYEDPEPERDKWRIIYRFYHIATDWWWTKSSREEQVEWEKRINGGNYPIEIDEYFWKIIEKVVENPLTVYEILPWKCNPLSPKWEQYIKNKQSSVNKKLGEWIYEREIKKVRQFK